MKIQIPDVTLCVIETKAPELAVLTVKDALNKIDFGGVLIYTNNLLKYSVKGAVNFLIEDWPSKIDWVNFNMFEAAKPVQTSHVLFMEWDAGVHDPLMWSPKFLEYDYIGAPWVYTEGFNVGNGGFSLRSKRLLDFLSENRDRYPITTSDSDAVICRTYRKALELEGFVWPSEEVALEFAFECTKRSRFSRHFGYHALRNWRFVLPFQDLIERMDLAQKNAYIVGLGVIDQFKRSEGPLLLTDD